MEKTSFRNAATLTMVFGALLITGCDKETQIAINENAQSTAKHAKEVTVQATVNSEIDTRTFSFEWEGNKLMKVTVPYDENRITGISFEYDGNRVIRAYNIYAELEDGVWRWEESSTPCVYEYSGNKLIRMTIDYGNGDIKKTTEFQYEDGLNPNKPTSIAYWEEEEGRTLRSVDTLIWDGDNVIEDRWFNYSSNGSVSTSGIMSFEFDGHDNPCFDYSSFFMNHNLNDPITTLALPSGWPEVLSKNNITSFSQGVMTDEISYTYDQDGNVVSKSFTFNGMELYFTFIY